MLKRDIKIGMKFKGKFSGAIATVYKNDYMIEVIYNDGSKGAWYIAEFNKHFKKI